VLRIGVRAPRWGERVEVCWALTQGQLMLIRSNVRRELAITEKCAAGQRDGEEGLPLLSARRGDEMTRGAASAVRSCRHAGTGDRSRRRHPRAGPSPSARCAAPPAHQAERDQAGFAFHLLCGAEPRFHPFAPASRTRRTSAAAMPARMKLPLVERRLKRNVASKSVRHRLLDVTSLRYVPSGSGSRYKARAASVSLSSARSGFSPSAWFCTPTWARLAILNADRGLGHATRRSRRPDRADDLHRLQDAARAGVGRFAAHAFQGRRVVRWFSASAASARKCSPRCLAHCDGSAARRRPKAVRDIAFASCTRRILVERGSRCWRSRVRGLVAR